MKRRHLLVGLVVVLLLATALRFHRLHAQSFWNDEGNSARLSERSVASILEGTASDIHPPLYYLLLRGWRELAGDSEFGLRSFSTVVGVLTVAVTAALAGATAVHRRPRAGAGQSALLFVTLSAALFAALNPVLVYYSQETRMYALLALIAALSSWTLLGWMARTDRARRAAAYVLLTAAGLYTHYFYPAVIVAQGLAALYSSVRPLSMANNQTASGRRRTGRFVAWCGLAALAVLIYLPWMPIFLRQIGGREGARPSITAFLAEAWRWTVLGTTVTSSELGAVLWAALALAIIGVAVAYARSPRRSGVPLLMALVPLALMYIAGATDAAFFKFLLVIVPFVCVLMGFASYARGLVRLLAVALSVALVFGGGRSLANLYSNPAYSRADYRGMAARIAADGYPDAGIILNGPNQWEVFTYYHRGGAPVYPIPRGQPDPAVLIPELERIAAAHDRLYALYWGERQRDPEGVIEGWLDGHTFKVSEEWVGDVRFVVYSVPQTGPDPQESGARFGGLDGESITLSAYAVWPEAARPGDIVQAQLTWDTDVTPARPYKVFIHLLDSAGRLVAQQDSEPGGGSRPTPSWVPGEPVIDNHGLLLPDDLTAGKYELRMGLYDAFDPALRLPVGESDSLLLATIRVP